MNTKIIYAVGIGIIVIGLVFYFSNSGFFNSQNSEFNGNGVTSDLSQDTVGSENSQVQTVPVSESQPQTNIQDLNVTLNSVEVLPVNNELRLQLAFDVYNPNRGAAILEYITFNVYLNDLRISSGDIGSEVAGFVDSLASVYTLIGNQTITLRGGEPLTREGSTFFDAQGNFTNGELINSSGDSTSSTMYNVNGTYAYTLNRGSDAQAREQAFSFPYPVQ